MRHLTNVHLFAGMYLWTTKWNKRQWGSLFFRYIFTGKGTSNLPVEGNSKGVQVTSDCGKYTTRLYLLPAYPKKDLKNVSFGRRRGTSRHRVYVICPLCGSNVWAGRINQHQCKAGI